MLVVFGTHKIKSRLKEAGVSRFFALRSVGLSLAAQLAALVAVAGVAWLAADFRVAASLAAGGLCCVVPAAMFATMLVLDQGICGRGHALTVFVGELAKVLLTISLLVMLGRVPDVCWAAVVVGIIVALMGNLFVFLKN